MLHYLCLKSDLKVWNYEHYDDDDDNDSDSMYLIFKNV